MTAPRLLVEAPAVVPYQYGLASIAQPAPMDGDHWQNGVEYEPISSYMTAIGVGACGAGATRVIPAGQATTRGLPFSMYAGVDCSPVGYDEDYVNSRAQAILKLGWQQAAETALWTGGGVTSLAPVLNSASTPVQATALSIVQAIAALEAYIRKNYLGVGVIHAVPAVAAYAQRNHLIVERVGKLQTILGTDLCFGGGYDGTGPGNVTPAANSTYLYATGLITIRRGEPRVNGGLPAGFIRETNHQKVYAEQPAVLTVDGPIVAVSVDLTK